MKLTQEAYQNDKNALGVTYETAALVGSRLRHARELKKLSPSQVSARVKIRDRYIDAIEIGDWDVLPPGLNGRGLIRLYARELGVSIPEFEAFHHLQTIMVEKQSESLMEASSKKSKYHPAAEESAEVIRSISRSEYQKNVQSEHAEYQPLASDESGFAQSRNTKIYSKPLYSQNNVTNASSAIVTPNIYDVLGLEVEEKVSAVPVANAEIKTKETVAIKRTLPTAEPIKKLTYPQETAENVEKNTVSKAETVEPKVQFKKDLNISLNKSSHTEILKEKKKIKIDLNPLQIIGVMGFLMIFIFVGLFLFSRNSGQIKVTNLTARQIETNIGESESLTESQLSENNAKDKKLAGSTEKLKDSAAQTKAVTPPSQKLSNTLEVERIAKFNISSRVTITVEADGKQVYSGTRDSGVLDVPFKDKAEIVISDASKVSLVYEGINHGSLGYPGRKRKIILNAKPYVD